MIYNLKDTHQSITLKMHVSNSDARFHFSLITKNMSGGEIIKNL